MSAAATEPRDMLGRARLTRVSDAQALLQSHLGGLPPASETLPLEQALDRVNACQILSPEDLPPAGRATMDGFAVVAADTFGASQSLPGYLDVVGEVLMGEVPEVRIRRGQCCRIPTGGLLPEGADAVLMLEHSVPVDDRVIEVVRPVGSGANLIRKGDDIRAGEVAVPAGTSLRPQELGLLAGLGIGRVEVFRQVTVAILSTGDEIVDFRSQPQPGKIRNINSVVLGSLVSRCGALARDYGIAPDDESSFFAMMETAIRENDLVLFSGGSSVGMRDLGAQAIERFGAPGILVHGVALKPGKPVLIGLCGKTPVFGLPGHPVSAMVCFEFFVEPAIHALTGRAGGAEPRPSVSARLMRNINSAAGRLDVVRVRLSREAGEILAHPLLGKSGAISTLSQAHGYFLIDEQSQGVSTGDLVDVYLYR